MAKIYKTPKPVVLDGFQAILKPSEYGYSLQAVVPEDVIELLEQERPTLLAQNKAKLKNPKRAIERPEPWEEVDGGGYKVKFKWDAKNKPTIVDCEGTLITDDHLPLYNGSKVRLAFIQRGYLLKDGVTYGTSLKLSGVQVVSLSGSPSAQMTDEEVVDLFGKVEGGFKYEELPPADVTEDTESAEDDVEF